MRRSLWLLVLVLLLPGAVHSEPAEIADFRSDGCSLFPDGSIRDPEQWCDCCFQHDIAYWKGGTRAERKRADADLRECVAGRTGNTVLANVMYEGVRAGGHPVFPNWYRWGYGWTYGRGYKPLTAEEQRIVTKKLDRYYREHPEGYCVEKKPVAASPTLTTP